MKKLFSILLALVLCISMSGCAYLTPVWSAHTLTIPDEEDAIYYNDRKYVEKDFGFMYFYPDYEEDWVHIATLPWDTFSYALLGAVSEFYGDDTDNPTVISCSRGGSLWFREDIVLDYNSTLSLCDSEESFQFSISEITKDNKLPYTEDLCEQAEYHKRLCASFAECPLVEVILDFYTINGTLYLQTDFFADYYEVTEEFSAILEQLDDYN